MSTKTGRNDHAARVDLFSGLCLVQKASGSNFRDSIAADGEVSIEPGVAGAIDNLSTEQHGILSFL